MKLHGLVFKTQFLFLCAVILPLLLLYRVGTEHYELRERTLYRENIEAHQEAVIKLEGIFQSYLARLRSLAIEFSRNKALNDIPGSLHTKLWLNKGRGVFRELEKNPRRLMKFRLAYSKLYLAYRRQIGLSLFPKKEGFDELKSPLRLQVYVIEHSLADPVFSEYGYHPSAASFTHITLSDLFPGEIPIFEEKREMISTLQSMGYSDWYSYTPTHPALYSAQPLINTIWEELVQLYRSVFRSLVFGKTIGAAFPEHGDEIFQTSILNLRGRFTPLRFLNRSLELFWEVIPRDFSLENYERLKDMQKIPAPDGILVAMIDSKAAQDHFLDLLKDGDSTSFLEPITSSIKQWKSFLEQRNITWSIIQDPNPGESQPIQTHQNLSSTLPSSIFPELSYVLKTSLSQIQNELRNYFFRLAAAGILIVLLSLSLAYILSNRIVNPILSLNDFAIQLVENRKPKIYESDYNHELAMLAIQFQEMAARIGSRVDALGFLQEIHEKLIHKQSHQVLPAILEGLVARVHAHWGCLGVFDQVIPRRVDDYYFSGGGEKFLKEIIGAFQDFSNGQGDSIRIQFWNTPQKNDSSLPRGLLCYASSKSTQDKKQVLLFLAGAEGDQGLIRGLMHQIQSVASRKFLEDIHADSTLGRKVQDHLLNIDKPARSTSIDLDFLHTAAGKIGGDFLSWIQVNSHLFRFFVGDISVSGISGALAAARLRARIRGSSSKENLLQILTSLNSILLELNHPEVFSSFVIVELDLKTSRIQYSRCGDCFLQFSRFGVEVPVQGKGSIPLGMLPNSRFYIWEEAINPGDSFLLGSNGIPNLRNSRDQKFGMEQIKAHFINLSNLNSREWISRFQRELKVFQQEAPVFDDQALLRVRLRMGDSDS